MSAIQQQNLVDIGMQLLEKYKEKFNVSSKGSLSES
jgi:ribosomal protein S17E